MRTYIIAEAGVNHNGSLEIALELVDKAKEAGADAIKFQTFTAENLVKKDTPQADYQKANMNLEESQFEMLKKLELSKDDHFKLLSYCSQRKIDFLSSPFDDGSFEFLADSLKLTRIKLGSGEITNGPLLMKIAQRGIELILSTGMSTLGDIETALGCLAFGYLKIETQPTIEDFINVYSKPEALEILKKKVVLLHCTSEYPAPVKDVNLRVIPTLIDVFGIPVGYSDHTQSTVIPSAAVALGAEVIEKHFTLGREMKGPDHKASIEPDEFKSMVNNIRDVENALGGSRKIVTSMECGNRKLVRKGLYAKDKIKTGETITADNIMAKRPADGHSPMLFWTLIDKKAEKDYDPDDSIR